jgi:hypothetical protein
MSLATKCTCHMSSNGFCNSSTKECTQLINMSDKKYQNCPICGTPCEVIHEHSGKPVEEIWESFWKPIVSNEDGTINIEQVKKELADFSFVMEQVPKVYCHITGDAMSKVMYKAEDVIRMADDHFNEVLREAVREEQEGEGQQGAVWVKASNFKTTSPVYRPFRRKRESDDEHEYDYGEIYITEDLGKIFLDVDDERSYEPQSHERWKDYEILDESGQSKEGNKLTQSRADFIREANNRDLGGVEGDKISDDTHEKEVMIRAFDKIRQIFSGRQWIMDGRGSYPYNDDRYREEVRYMYDEFDALVKDTWANIKSHSSEYRQAIIAEHVKGKEGNKEREVAFAEWLNKGYICIEEKEGQNIYVKYGPQEYHRKQQYVLDELWNEWNNQNRNDETRKNIL